METERHREQMWLLIESLRLFWKDRTDFYVGGNMFVYFSAIQALKNDFRGPDVFVVLDTERRERKSWVVWKEGKAPDVVIELTSETTEQEDRGRKKQVYASQMRVPFYGIYDPFTAELEGYTLDAVAREYKPVATDENGDLLCDLLGLRLGVRRGIHAGIEAPWLRWIDAQGTPLPTGEEQAAAEATRATAEAARAEAEAAHAEQETQRAEGLAARLAEYKKRFGPL